MKTFFVKTYRGRSD